MPITAFSSFTDGLEACQRNRGHFVANIDVNDQRRWVPYAEGVWIQPCCFNVTSGGFSTLLKGLPGAKPSCGHGTTPIRAARRSNR